MSRVSLQTDKEPFIKLQRPASASYHSTAHIVDSCFGDIIGLDDPSYTVSNQPVLEPEQKSDDSTQDEQFKQIYVTYRQRVKELSLLEEHLTRAKTQALVDDEAHLASLKKEFASYKEPILPEGPSSFRKYLDEDLLKRHNLLVPSSYFPNTQNTYQPPRAPDIPNHQQTTQSFCQHSSKQGRKLPVIKDGAVSRRKEETTKQKPLWKGGMSAEERMEGKAALAELTRKSEYLRNPRYRSTLLPNTAASTTVNQTRTSSSTTNLSSDEDFFVSEPTEVVFTDYSTGKSHEATIVLKNISSASHQLRILPPKSPYFSVSHGQFPTPDGVMAPGMSCSYKITFVPDTLADFDDELTTHQTHQTLVSTCVYSMNDISLQILLHTGGSFSVPLKGRRPHPDLSLPLEIDVGSWLAGGSKEVVLPCRNSGGEGGFVFHRQDSLPSFVATKGKTVLFDGSCEAGVFSVSPRGFHITPGSSVDVKISFSPGAVDEYRETLTLSCDNCSTYKVTLTGVAEKLSVGVSEVDSCPKSEKNRTLSCVDFRPSTAGSVALDYSEDPDSALLQTDVGHREAAFGDTNPHVPVCRKLKVRNSSESQLPFQWTMYHPHVDPVIKATGTGGDNDSGTNDSCSVDTSLLHKSSSSPFDVHPICGCFEPAETKTFILSFNPTLSSCYTDVAHLTIIGIPQAAVDEGRMLVLRTKEEGGEGEEESVEGGEADSTDCTVSVLSIEMSGQCEVYKLDLIPPRMDGLGSLNVGVQLKRSIKIVNRSLCNVQFEWRWRVWCEADGSEAGDEEVIINVDPPDGTVVAGCECTCSVNLVPRKPGMFTVSLMACIKHIDAPLVCPIALDVKGPVVSLEVPSLDFQLVRVGKRATLALPLRNESSVPAIFSISPKSLEAGSSVLTDCIEMKVCEGELPPGGHTTLLVVFSPTTTGHLRALLQCTVEGSRPQFVSVTGEAQRPLVSLDHCHHHADEAYLNVVLQGTVLLRNHTLLPTEFVWGQKLLGEGAGVCSLTLSPSEGHIGAREKVPIQYSVTWTKKGLMPPAIATCFISEMEHPVHLSLSANVKGVSVLYELLTDEDKVMGSCGGEGTDNDAFLFDFGRSCPLGSERCLKLRITNQSGIVARVASHVVNFPPALVEYNHTEIGSTSKLSISRRSLLSRTVNLGSSHSKTDQQADRDLQSALLADNRGACFVVSPASVELLPFSSETLTLKAYSNMWGDYRDRLVVQVDGLGERSFPISYSAVGCPIRFMNTCSSGSSSLRCGSHPVNAAPVKRSFKLQNASPVDIRIDWETYCCLSESQDTKLIDFVMRIGDPFPLNEDTLMRGESKGKVSTSFISPRDSPHQRWMESKTGQLVGSKSVDDQWQSDRNSEKKNKQNETLSQDQLLPKEEDSSLSSLSVDVSQPLIKAFITPHEGVPSTCPYTIHPSQLVLPPKSQSAITITFTPSLEALNTYGRNVPAYGIGFLSLEKSKDSEYVTRASGDDITPLRIDLVGSIEHPQLRLSSEDSETPNVLTLRARADEIFTPSCGMDSTGTVEGSFFFHNPTSSELFFSLATSQPFSLVTVDPGTRQGTSDLAVHLLPRKTLHVKILFPLSLQALKDLMKATTERDPDSPEDTVPSSVSVAGELTVTYNTGAIQTWPLSSSVILPCLSLSPGDVTFDRCFVGVQTTSSLTLRNSGYCSAYWTAEFINGHQSFSISSSSGVLSPHMTNGQESVHSLVVSYQPQIEEEDKDVLLLTETITGWSTEIPLKGTCSADEKHYSYH